MQYRPKYRLDRLRIVHDDSSDRRLAGDSLLLLRWQRTIVVDLSRTAGRDSASGALDSNYWDGSRNDNF